MSKKIRQVLAPVLSMWSKRGTKESGSVSSSIISYISVGQWLTIGAVVTIVTLSWEQLSTAFMTNVPLNGLIISVMLIGVGRAIWSNMRLWLTSRFLHRIRYLTERDEAPKEAEVVLLRRQLKRGASILDTKQMYDLLGNMTQYGQLNVTDNDARMIKSKMGFRVSKMRENTGFLAGMLVMLGLLGTFWGLLATIDAVGKAMGGMANIGNADASEMGGFIGQIAAPLEGMGLAFSSSLFGLSGSLIIGFYNFLCGGVHNAFIESVSRWIDEQIPAPKEKMKKAQHNPKVAGSDELKAWLAGFVQTSMQTNRKVAELIDVFSTVAETVLATAQQVNSVRNSQQGMHSELVEMRRSYARGLAVIRKEVNDRSFDMAQKLRTSVTRDFQQAMQQLQATTETQEELNQVVGELEQMMQRDEILQSLESDEEGLPLTQRPTDVSASTVDKPPSH